MALMLVVYDTIILLVIEHVTEVLQGANALVHIENQPEPQELDDSQGNHVL